MSGPALTAEDNQRPGPPGLLRGSPPRTPLRSGLPGSATAETYRARLEKAPEQPKYEKSLRSPAVPPISSAGAPRPESAFRTAYDRGPEAARECSCQSIPLPRQRHGQNIGPIESTAPRSDLPEPRTAVPRGDT